MLAEVASVIAVALEATPPPASQLDPRTSALLHAPIVPLLLRMAWPNVVVMLAQAGSGLIETFWVGRLGTDALAGMALVFPGVMLMQMISAGSLGGGISSAIARALGSRRAADILANWETSLKKFRKVMPVEYRRALKEMQVKAATMQAAE